MTAKGLCLSDFSVVFMPNEDENAPGAGGGAPNKLPPNEDVFVTGAYSTKDEVSVAIDSFAPNTEVGRNAKDAFCSDDEFSLKIK